MFKKLREITKKTTRAGILLVLLGSCKTVSVNDQSLYRSDDYFELGMIGIQEKGIRSDELMTTALPELSMPIKLSAKLVEFDKKTYKTYLSASPENTQDIAYIDSLEPKPKLLYLQIADRVGMVNMLNDKGHTDIKRYLEKKDEAVMVSSLGLALSKEDLDKFATAEAFFLVSNDYKQYRVRLIDNEKVIDTFRFKDATIISYGLSSFCWGSAKGESVEIRDMVPEGEQCPDNTYKKAKRAVEKFDPYKF